MTPVAVSIQPKMLAAATMNSTVEVVSTVSRQTLTNIFQVSVRYQAKPSTIAQMQAAIAPSVGVNRPVVMPPISSTGVMIGSTAWNLKYLSAANSTTSAGEHRDLRLQRRPASPAATTQRPADHHGHLGQRLDEARASRT